MGDSGGGSQTTVSKNEIPPWLEGITKENVDMAKQVAARPYQPYPGQTVAAFSPTQLSAYNYAANTVGQAEPAYAAAQNGAFAVSGYTPQMVGGKDLTAYMNPYTQNVIDRTTDRMARDRAVGANSISDAAAKANAFGGNRHAIQSAVYGAETNRNIGDAAAALNKDAFNTAAGIATADANRDLQGAQLNLQGATSLANIAQAGQDNRRRDAEVLEAAGRAYTAQDQAYLNDAYKRWQGEWNYPVEQLNLRLAATSATPYSTTQTQIAPDNTSSNGFLSGLGAVGSAASGIAKLFALSDEREKTNKQKLGKDPQTGLDLYAYDYKADVEAARKSGKPMPPKRVGPMAQDIERQNPDAVSALPNGVKMVNLGFGPVRRRG